MDKDLLKFPKLEELVLSANQIKEIDAVNLPPTLKVKEPRVHFGPASLAPPRGLPSPALPCPVLAAVAAGKPSPTLFTGHTLRVQFP